jgi:peptide/nickel transport system substrate-binding protein
VFGTGAVGSDALDPMLNAWLRTNGEAAWFGWPSDDKIEALRVEWFKATDLETRKRLATEIQERAFEVVPYIPIGRWMGITAYRNSLKGLILGPAIFQWNVEKT